MARAALDAGAAIVNDVSGLRLDPAMPGHGRRSRRPGAHALAGPAGSSRVSPPTAMPSTPAASPPPWWTTLRAAERGARDAGISESRIAVDPGLGFSKTVSRIWRCWTSFPRCSRWGGQLLVGPSRKRFLAGEAPPAERDTATAAACVVAWERGARLFRVHDVATTRDALTLSACLSTSPAMASLRATCADRRIF